MWNLKITLKAVFKLTVWPG